MATATRALAALALLVLSACGVEAQTHTQAGKPLEGVTGPNCSPEQRQAVDSAMAEARRRLAIAIRFVQERPNDPHVIRWFGEGQNGLVLKTLRLTAERMNRPGSLTIHCNDPPTCARGQMAYARTTVSLLGVCPPFFRAGWEGQDNRWGILIHEVSHIAAGTQDFAYQPRGAQALAKEDPSRAARNADNYEYFVEFLPVR
ncbi:MAG TPA: M35 family metallopeptidase [Acetobacteraceae bacterium]|nr:M35 family metallopeptidase [Acetobacteraceae bacterium]